MVLKLSVFTVMLPELTPEEGAQALRRHGYDGVEWRVSDEAGVAGEVVDFWSGNRCTLPLDEAGARRAKAVADAAGLAIPGLGSYIDVGDLESLGRAMRFAQICGARNVRVNSGRWPDPQGLSYTDSFARAEKFLAECQRLGRQHNVRAIIELHHGTISSSAALAHRLVESFDPDFIGVLHDAGNGIHEGYEQYDMALQLLGPWLAHVHIKNARHHPPDSGRGLWRTGWAPLDDGAVNWEELFQALRRVGYEGWLGIEDFSRSGPLEETLSRNREFLLERIAQAAEAS